MTLTDEDIDFIKAHMAQWLAEQSLGKPPAVYEIELRERMVRVEEELKYQRELMREGFAQMDKRFELTEQRDRELRADMLARFEQVDKRFELSEQRDRELRADMLARFEQSEQRDREQRADVLARFEQVDRRFERVDQRFDEMIRRHDRHFLWLIIFITVVGGLIISAVKLW
jgi:hypothetical protein